LNKLQNWVVFIYPILKHTKESNVGFFFPSILWSIQTNDRSQQEDWAKFNNGPIIRVEIFKNPFIFWLPYGFSCTIMDFLFFFFPNMVK
jgi:hypothetical protein